MSCADLEWAQTLFIFIVAYIVGATVSNITLWLADKRARNRHDT